MVEEQVTWGEGSWHRRVGGDGGFTSVFQGLSQALKPAPPLPSPRRKCPQIVPTGLGAVWLSITHNWNSFDWDPPPPGTSLVLGRVGEKTEEGLRQWDREERKSGEG